MDLADVALLGYAASTLVLTGLVWTVQLVVYPGFGAIGPTPVWPAVHRAHASRMALVVGPPWAVQGAATAVLLLTRPDEPLVLLAAALAAVPVAVTVAVSVPQHTRLSRGWDEAAWRRLVRTNWLRTAGWTAGAACALALLG